jgi:protein PhnA
LLPKSAQLALDPSGLRVLRERAEQWIAALMAAPVPVRAVVRTVGDKYACSNVLVTGDDVVLIKDLKLEGSSTTLKGRTTVKRIRVEPARAQP